VKSRVHLVSLPQKDLEEKSLAEGFGLTVTEGLWKSRAMVASKVGGIQDQIDDGESGLLVDDPADYESFGKAIDSLLADDKRSKSLGEAGRETIRGGFLAVQRLTDHFKLIDSLHDA